MTGHAVAALERNVGTVIASAFRVTFRKQEIAERRVRGKRPPMVSRNAYGRVAGVGPFTRCRARMATRSAVAYRTPHRVNLAA